VQLRQTCPATFLAAACDSRVADSELCWSERPTSSPPTRTTNQHICRNNNNRRRRCCRHCRLKLTLMVAGRLERRDCVWCAAGRHPAHTSTMWLQHFADGDTQRDWRSPPAEFRRHTDVARSQQRQGGELRHHVQPRALLGPRPLEALEALPPCGGRLGGSCTAVLYQQQGAVEAGQARQREQGPQAADPRAGRECCSAVKPDNECGSTCRPPRCSSSWVSRDSWDRDGTQQMSSSGLPLQRKASCCRFG
jgi:hypothetical protein